MELYSNVKLSPAFAPGAAITNDTAAVSAILDCANFEHNLLGFVTGTNADTDATFTLLLEESDDSAMGSATAVADADLLGTEALASFTFADDAETRKIGYRGMKRYIRATLTPANNTGNFFVGGMWLQSGARKAPQA